MGEVFLHLGLAKTGTSYLQHQVFPKMDLTFYHCHNYDIIDKPVKGKTLYSFEGFSGTPMDNNRYVILYRLHRLFPNAKVFVMFRREHEYIRSLYSQYVKGGGTRCIDWFHSWLSSHPYFLDWELYKKQIIRLWGEQNVLFGWHHDLREHPSLFLYRLCEWLGVPYTVFENKKINRSLTAQQEKTWVLLNHFFRSRWNPDALLPRWLNPCYLWWKVSKHYE